MPISPLCDPEKHADMAKSQNGFLEFVVKPLLKEIEEIEPFAQIKYDVFQQFGIFSSTPSHVKTSCGKALFRKPSPSNDVRFLRNTISKHLSYNMSKWQMLQDGGHPIVLNSLDNAAKTTVTAGAVRKIAGIRRGPPHRPAESSRSDAQPMIMPTQLQNDLERAGQEPHSAIPPTPETRLPERSPAAPDFAAPSDAYEADFSGTSFALMRFSGFFIVTLLIRLHSNSPWL